MTSHHRVPAADDDQPQRDPARPAAEAAEPAFARQPAWLLILALAAAYCATARLGLLLAMPGGHVTPVWPPSGIALAAVLLCGRRVWPGIWLGSFAANLWDFYGGSLGLAGGILTSASFGAGASVAALLGAELLRRYVGGRSQLEWVRDVAAFMALGGVASCLVSATVGVTALCLSGSAPWSAYGQIWLTWWLGDTAGVFVVAPLLLVWSGPVRLGSRLRALEAACCFGLLIAVAYGVFIQNTTALFSGKPFTFTLIPFLVWPSIRFGRRGAVLAVAVIAGLAVWGTIHGSGPFNVGPRNEALLVLELFLSVVVLSALCLAAIVTEAARAEEAKKRAFDELEARVQERTAALTGAIAQLHAEVAERTQMEAKLTASESRLRTIIDTEPECVNLLAADGALLEMNRAGLQMIEAEEFRQVENHCVFPLIVPEHRPQFVALTAQIFRGESGTLEFQITGLKGTRRWLETHASPLRGPDGKVTALLGLTRDITERKRAEAALRVSESRLRRLVTSNIIGVILAGVDGRIFEANDLFLQMVGCTRAELEAGQLRWDVLTPPEWCAVDEHIISELKRAGVCLPVEKEYLHKDGHRVPIRVSVALLDGTAGDCICLIEDITVRKAAEAGRARLLAQEHAARTEADAAREHVAHILESVSGQLAELRRWQQATLAREDRLPELKREIN